jgi:hypothetical protein
MNKINLSGAFGKQVMELAQELILTGVPYDKALELATGQEVTARLEQSETLFQGLYQQAAGSDPSENLIWRKSSTDGYAEFGDLFVPGKMKEWKGKAELHDWESASYRVPATLKTWEGGIDVNKLSRLDSIFDDGFQRSLQQKISIVRQGVHDSFSALLNANAVHPLTGVTFYNTANVIPRTGESFSNELGFDVTDTATMRTAIRNAQKGILKQTNISGGTIWQDPSAMTFVLITHPDNFDKVEDAVRPGNIDKNGAVVLNDKAPMPSIRPIYNKDLDATSDYFFFLDAAAYPSFVMAVEEEPSMISTLGSGGHVTKIMFNRELAQIRHSYGMQYGSPLGTFRIKAA